jgi:predicted membrane channel-forming protein YqfA (hemolysin III family)
VPARVLGPSSFVGKQFLVHVHFLLSNSWFHMLGSMLFFALGVMCTLYLISRDQGMTERDFCLYWTLVNLVHLVISESCVNG